MSEEALKCQLASCNHSVDGHEWDHEGRGCGPREDDCECPFGPVLTKCLIFGCACEEFQ